MPSSPRISDSNSRASLSSSTISTRCGGKSGSNMTALSASRSASLKISWSDMAFSTFSMRSLTQGVRHRSADFNVHFVGIFSNRQCRRFFPPLYQTFPIFRPLHCLPRLTSNGHPARRGRPCLERSETTIRHNNQKKTAVMVMSKADAFTQAGKTAVLQNIQGTLQFLQRFPPFNQMENAHLAYLVEQCQLRFYAPGESIIKPADGPIEHFYIVKQGRVVGERPHTAKGGTETTFEITTGECFPLAALLGERAT